MAKALYSASCRLWLSELDLDSVREVYFATDPY
jgi:hypothetical protein